MIRVIKINIPEELKILYKKEKHIIIENHYKYLAEDIEHYLKKDDIYGVYSNIIPSLKKEVTFFKKYQEWLDFILLNLMSSVGIKINNIDDLYSTLQIVKVQLQNNKDTNIEYLLNKCIKHQSTCNDKYVTNPQASEMYLIYLKISLGIIDINELIDTSYDYYLRNTSILENSKTKRKQNM